jgi:hypothetical protein
MTKAVRMRVSSGSFITDAITKALKQRKEIGDVNLVFEFNGADYLVTSTDTRESLSNAYDTVMRTRAEKRERSEQVQQAKLRLAPKLAKAIAQYCASADIAARTTPEFRQLQTVSEEWNKEIPLGDSP